MNAGSGFLISGPLVVLFPPTAAPPKPPKVVEPPIAVLPNVGVALVDEAEPPPNGDEPKAGAGVAALPLWLAPNMFAPTGVELAANRLLPVFVDDPPALPKTGGGNGFEDAVGLPKIEVVC